jgi:hypothetical protein
VLPGGTLPLGPYDNRSAAELTATDGSEYTDVAMMTFGLSRDVDFIHTFAFDPDWRGAGWAVLELGIGGMQSNDNDPNTFGLGEDALRIDGDLVLEAFAGIDQGATGYGVIRVVLPPAFLPLFADGEVHVFIDLNSNAGAGTLPRTEPVFYDFSRLTISEIPEPSTILLVPAGLVALRLRKRARAPV